MSKLTKKNFDSADNTAHPSKNITADRVDVNGLSLHRVTAQPGWKWSVDLKPLFKTDSCPEDHLLYMISGKMAVRMDDGEELEYGPGDIAAIPPGHDGWGIGDEPSVWLDIPH